MYFRRIEAILIAVFLGINLFLGFEIMHAPIQLSNATPKVSLSQEMASNNILLPKKLSDQPQDGYYLAAKVDDQLSQAAVPGTSSYSAANKLLTVNLLRPLKLSRDDQRAVKTVKAFVRDPFNVAHGQQYAYDPVASNKQEYVFFQKSAYGPIYFNGARLEVLVEHGSIVGYRQAHLNRVTAVRERQATISARRAVKSLYTVSELPNNTKVNAVQLGYGHLTNVRSNIILLPVWRIDLQSRATKSVTVKQINAFTGALLPTGN